MKTETRTVRGRRRCDAREGAVHRFVRRIRSLLAHRRLPAVAVFLGIAAALPALWSGWYLDDLSHRAALLDPARLHGVAPRALFRVPHPLDIFRFVTGDPAETSGRVESGMFPWWTSPDLKLAFFRPLTSLTHWLDYRLWPDSAVLMHTHSLVWLGALIVAVGLLYRRLLGPGAAAGLALLAYALDDAHGMPAGWLAGRNGLTSAVFGIAAVVAHDRWRRGGWRPGSAVGPLLFALGLLCGEAGVGAAAYLVAYALFLDRGNWRRRLLSLLPYGIIGVGWRAATTALGYGAAASGFYVDPGREPLRFLVTVGERLPLLMLGQWSPIPLGADLFQTPAGYRLQWLQGLAVCAVAGVLALPLARRNAVARFFALGMVLSMIPICATFPNDRLLLFAALGGFGLFAQVAAQAARPVKPVGRPLLVTATALLAVVYLLVSPVLMLARVAFMPWFAHHMDITMPPGVDPTGKSLVVLHGPGAFFSAYLPVERSLAGLPVPRTLRYLSASGAAAEITRTDERTLVVRPAGGYLATPFDLVTRDPALRSRSAERITLSDVEVEVLEVTSDGRPSAARFAFRRPLEDESFIWLDWVDARYRPVRPPAAGETVRLPPPELF